MKKESMNQYLENLSSLIEDYKFGDISTHYFITCVDNIAQNMKLEQRVIDESNVYHGTNKI